MNQRLAVQVLQAFLNAGGTDICLCPGARNSPLISLVAAHSWLKTYYFYEERSAAFFALGLSRRQKRPVALIVTSGTAAVELMPAITEAYYTGVPLLAITADRPRSYRGSNAPQSCEQVGLYGVYAPWSVDLEGLESLDLSSWNQKSPGHINVCFTEPSRNVFVGDELFSSCRLEQKKAARINGLDELSLFLAKVKRPLALIGALEPSVRECVKRFLIRLNIPVYAEGISGIRESPSLNHLRIHNIDHLFKRAEAAAYPIDGIIRIGGIPTARLWRDLENLRDKVNVCSISDVPYAGLSWGTVICTDLELVFDDYVIPANFSCQPYTDLLQNDLILQHRIERALANEPTSEPALIRAIAEKMPADSFVYLGNSLPIRHWDLAAPYQNRGFDVWATRGLNGIDGQVSTFFGLGLPSSSNWAFLGDLTTLYDMPGFWVASQLKNLSFNVIVMNNGGGQIFSRMFEEPQFINGHSLQFKGLAELWGLEYERWDRIPNELPRDGRRIIELVPDHESYSRFLEALNPT